MSARLDDPRALCARLLTGLGLSAAPGCYPLFSKCDEPPTYSTTVNLDAAPVDDTADTAAAVALESCPTDLAEIEQLFRATGAEVCSVDEATLVSEEGRDCAYSYTCWTCCGYGRPYLDARGEGATAETQPGAGWTRPDAPPEASLLTAEERRAVGLYWLEVARSEHSSVAGFHRFALDLLAHGAPPELLARAQRAAAQELRHAMDAFTLASAYLGEPVGPSPMALGASAPVASSLAELAAWTARDGAIGETLAAHLAAAALHETTDEAARAVLERVVRDETEHAELAWATLRWALATGGDEVRQAVLATFSRLGAPRSSTQGWTLAQTAHGVAAPEQEEARARTAVDRIILPVAAALLEATAHA